MVGYEEARERNARRARGEENGSPDAFHRLMNRSSVQPLIASESLDHMYPVVHAEPEQYGYDDACKHAELQANPEEKSKRN